MKFDHIGIITEDLESGRAALADIFQITGWSNEFRDPVNRVFVQFGLDSSGICYELIAPLGDQSPVTNALRTRRNVLNHVAYLVPDLAAARERLRDAGAIPTADPNPAVAYAGKPIQFFLTPMHFIVELIEAPNHPAIQNQ